MLHISIRDTVYMRYSSKPLRRLETATRPQASGSNAGVGVKRKSDLSEAVTPRLSRAPVGSAKSRKIGEKIRRESG